MPYGESSLFDPNVQPYGRWAASPTNHLSLDGTFHLDSTGFEILPNNSAHFRSSSVGASFAAVGIQNSHYVGLETHSITANSQEYDGMTDIFQDCGNPNNLSFPATTNNLTPPSQAAAEFYPAQKSNSTPSTDSRVRQRNFNTLAARRYRQRRTDETHNLAAQLKETQAERDGLKVLVARLEGELEVLRQILRVRESH
ncbi:hypothetical protein MMC28_005362 [Mycoblastus sanguinarius]|nr:hypothetical protein [Mycoblastus sanguinarius]